MKPVGFVQVDVDGLWAVRACYGKAEKNTYADDPCWQEGVPLLTGLFERLGIPAALFLVGRDLELPAKAAAAGMLARAGFELGNHSYSHRLGLTLEPSGVIFDEIRSTDLLLRRVGANPVGFRAPGYDVDARVARAVRRAGYLYDASMLPTYLSPLLRLADAWLSRKWDPNKRQFGRFSYGRAPRSPYFPRVHAIRKPAPDFASGRLVEIPVGTTPFWRLPLTAATFFRMSDREVRDLFARLARKGRPTMLLLHAIDGTDCRAPIVFDDRRPKLGGFALSSRAKEARLRRILEAFATTFRVERADEFASRMAKR